MWQPASFPLLRAGLYIIFTGLHWDAEPHCSAGAPGGTVPQAGTVSPEALQRRVEKCVGCSSL